MADWRDWDIEEIPEWNENAQHVLLAICAFTLLAVMSYFVFVPLRLQIDEANQKEKLLKNQFRQKVQQHTALSDIKQRIRRMESAFEQVVKSSANENQLAKVLASINTIGLNNNLLFQRVDWQDGRQFEHFYQLPIELEIKGHFQDFGGFSEALAKLPQLIKIQELNIKVLSSHNSNESYHAVQPFLSPKQANLHFSVKAYSYHFSNNLGVK